MRSLPCGLALCLAIATAPAAAADDAAWSSIDRLFETWRLDAHVPGLVYGVVIDGRLVHVCAFGVQDTSSQQPVAPNTRFGIASMSKAFTALAILKLRDDGELSVDAPVETYVPEMKDWTYPTKDGRRLRVRDLLHHVGGLVCPRW